MLAPDQPCICRLPSSPLRTQPQPTPSPSCPQACPPRLMQNAGEGRPLPPAPGSLRPPLRCRAKATAGQGYASGSGTALLTTPGPVVGGGQGPQSSAHWPCPGSARGRGPWRVGVGAGQWWAPSSGNTAGGGRRSPGRALVQLPPPADPGPGPAGDPSRRKPKPQPLPPVASEGLKTQPLRGPRPHSRPPDRDRE